MYIPDPWMGASGPGTAGQTVDVTAEVIGKRRSARDAAIQHRKKQEQEQQAAMMQSPAFAAASNIAAQMIRY